jgi:hypothetical protein
MIERKARAVIEIELAESNGTGAYVEIAADKYMAPQLAQKMCESLKSSNYPK